MNLNDFFQISVSVFCSLATVFMLAFLVWAIVLHRQISRLVKKLLEITEIAKTTAGDTQDFVNRTIKSLEAFKQSIFTFEFVRRIIQEIIDLVRNNSREKVVKSKIRRK